jgi:hypothetical protein
MNPTRTAFLSHCRDSLDGLRREGRYREFARLEKLAGQFPRYRWHAPDGAVREVTVWSSNDYLGMGCHEAVREAAAAAARTHGAGAGGTRNISGTSPLHAGWRRSSPRCTASRPRCCSAAATSPTRPASPRCWRGCRASTSSATPRTMRR